jgi:hypothetical protein
LQQFYICTLAGKSVVRTPIDLKSKQDWCPLKPIQSKKDEDKIYTMTQLYRAQGFNACIDEILGGKE